jgi:hypothetical protein
MFNIHLETCVICVVVLFQAESVRDAAWGCDWVGTPVPFQRCLVFIIATANKEFTLTAGKFVPVSNLTMMNVRVHIKKGNSSNYLKPMNCICNVHHHDQMQLSVLGR